MSSGANKAIHAGDPPKTIDELDALAAEYTSSTRAAI